MSNNNNTSGNGVQHGVTRFTEYDIHLFKEGNHYHLHDKFGAHIMEAEGTHGVFFAVWAPNAQSVSVIGDFNYWDDNAHHLAARWDQSGVWEGFIPGVQKGALYKYCLTAQNGQRLEKADPFALFNEVPPKTASIVWDLEFDWNDADWLTQRAATKDDAKPYSVYEIHFASWRRKVEEDNRSLSYAEMAHELVEYVKDLGFTHVEFMPIMEHPYGPSWGYQITGYFAPTSRFGTPQEFMQLVNALHQAGIGVILDWVPSHFPADAHGLAIFDGTHLYEHEDPRKGFHPDWKSFIFNYGRNEVRAILISNALFWIKHYHADGLRVDAVASMLYLDYSRNEGEWEPNEYGGNENIEAISFLRKMNETVYGEFPDIVTIAEESTSWPMVSRPTYMGGLGFGQKWMMGWMHDTLTYFKKEAVYRKYHHNEITFSIMYAFTENFMLPLSHDEVVHGKGSLLARMPGDDWQRFANLRLMFGYMFLHPGTQLIFMGGEIGQSAEWNHESSVDWHLLDNPLHKGIQSWIKRLNAFNKAQPSLYEYAFQNKGFEWVDYSDGENSIIIFQRNGKNPDDTLVVVLNFTPVPRNNYRIGVPHRGYWKEVLNSDATDVGGSGVTNIEIKKTIPVSYHNRDFAISISLPPLGITVMALEKRVDEFEIEVS